MICTKTPTLLLSDESVEIQNQRLKLWLLETMADWAGVQKSVGKRRKTINQTVLQLWNNIRIQENGCWEWSAGRFQNGYGKLKIGAKTKKAHVVAFVACNGFDKLAGRIVCHTCDNPPCCNPDHLFSGTVRDNSIDAISKGKILLGENHPNARLTNDNVREIRKRYGEGNQTIKNLAFEYGVGSTTIGRVVHRRQWKWI